MTSPEKLATPDSTHASVESALILSEQEISEAFDEAFPGHDFFQQSLDFGRAVERRVHLKLLARTSIELVIARAENYCTSTHGTSASEIQQAHDALRAEVTRLATQRQGEGETREAALEQAANLVECEHAADATQGRRLAQIAQHIRDLKKRGA